jgi:hypothetical protein
MAAGSIVVELLAKTGSFETDTARAAKGFKKNAKDIEDAVKGIAATVGAYVGINAFVNLVKGAIDASDHLHDLSQKTGIAADTLGGLGFAAQQSGGDLESFVAGAGKLNKALAEAAAGNVEVSNAFKALGINVLDSVGNTKLADVALAEIADKFAKLADGPEKVALAIKLFGKAGADMIPILNEGGASLLANVEYFKRYSGVTLETAAAADKFNDTLAKVHLLQQAFAKNLAAELLPILQTLANRFVDAKEQGDGFAGVAKKIAGALSGIAEVASFVVESLSAMSARLDGLIQKAGVLKDATPLPTGNVPFDLFNQARAFTSADVKSQFEQINKIQDEGVAAAQKRHDRLVASLNFSVDPADAGHEGHGRELKKPPAARLPAVGAADNAAAELKKTLEGEIKNIEAFGRLQSQAFSFANAALDGVFAEGNLGLRAYFDEQNRLRDAQATAREGQIDKAIALERKFANDPRAKPTDRIAALEKIKELETERAGLGLKNAQDAVLSSQREDAALKQLQNQFESVNAQVLELGENFARAAAIKFDLQFDALAATFKANGNAAGREALETLRAAAIAQGAFQKASLDAGRTLDALSNAEERVALAQQTGAIGSLQALAQVGDLRRAQIPILEAQVQAEEAIAKASRNPTLIQNAAAARLALDKLKASADPLAESLNKVFGADFNSALDDFVTGTKSASEAFRSFAKSVLNDILKLGTKSITESIFGGSGGAGGFISDLFKGQSGGGLIDGLKSAIGIGSSGSAAGAVADATGTAARAAETAAVSASTASFAALTASGGASAVAFDAAGLAASTLATAAASASAALAAMAATSTASSGEGLATGFAALAGISGGRAEGGSVIAGQSYIVGERGPEVLHMGSTSGNVTPNRALGGATQNIVVNVTGQPGQSRDALLNQGVVIGQGIQKALARNA